MYTSAAPQIVQDVEKEGQAEAEQSALSILSNALEKLNEPPPTRPSNDQQAGGQFKKIPLLVERVKIPLSSDSDDEPAGTAGRSGDGDGYGYIRPSSKPFSLVSHIKISSSEYSLDEPEDTTLDSEAAVGKPFELVERRAILSGLLSIYRCFRL